MEFGMEQLQQVIEAAFAKLPELNLHDQLIEKNDQYELQHFLFQ